VDDTAGLHHRIDGRRADETKAGLAQALRELDRSGSLRVPLSRRRPIATELPDELLERVAGVAEGDRRVRVRDRRLDLAAVADDPRIAEEPLDVALAEPCDRVRIEAGEGGPEVLPLPQDRQPRKPGLETLEAQLLVEPALVVHRPSPF